jgi:hypothetical protein
LAHVARGLLLGKALNPWGVVCRREGFIRANSHVNNAPVLKPPTGFISSPNIMGRVLIGWLEGTCGIRFKSFPTIASLQLAQSAVSLPRSDFVAIISLNCVHHLLRADIVIHVEELWYFTH